MPESDAWSVGLRQTSVLKLKGQSSVVTYTFYDSKSVHQSHVVVIHLHSPCIRHNYVVVIHYHSLCISQMLQLYTTAVPALLRCCTVPQSVQQSDVVVLYTTTVPAAVRCCTLLQSVHQSHVVQYQSICWKLCYCLMTWKQWDGYYARKEKKKSNNS